MQTVEPTQVVAPNKVCGTGMSLHLNSDGMELQANWNNFPKYPSVPTVVVLKIYVHPRVMSASGSS